MSVIFRDPPPNKSGRPGIAPWDEISAALRENPERWALVLQGASNYQHANAIKNGRIKAFCPAGAFEARSVKTDNGYDIYARFVGEGATS